MNNTEEKSSTLFTENFDNILKCVHCGLCLDSCPTYRESGLEQDSPRGRLFIMRGVWSGQFDFTKENTHYLNRCIDCRACETACPSKVPYGELIEKTRGVLWNNRPNFQSKTARMLLSMFYKKILPSDLGLVIFSKILKTHKKLNLGGFLRRLKILRLFPGFVEIGESMLPNCEGTSFKKGSAAVYPAADTKIIPQKVALFSGCLTDVSEHETHRATLRLLSLANYETRVPVKQACCGALSVHGGDRQTGRMLAKKNFEAFTSMEYDHVITNAGGCSAQLKEYHLLFEKTDRWRTEITRLEEKIIDILELLGKDCGWVSKQEWQEEWCDVFYDAPCHLIHAQGVNDKPLRLLSALPGVRVLPLDESSHCCGSGGIYNLLQPELSEKVLFRKMASLKQAFSANPSATTLLSGNPGCVLQLRRGVEMSQLPVKVMHPVVFIAERLRTEKRDG